MKNLYLRSALVVACALTFSACGGDDNGTIPLYGTVSGVNMEGMVLQNNGGADLVIAPNTLNWQFPQLIGSSAEYNVTIKSSPSNANCRIVNGKGRATVYGIGQIAVICDLIQHKLSGKITGNTTGETVIVNGSDRVTVAANVGDFTMTKLDDKGAVASGTVGEGQPYGVLVLTPPPGKTCTVANGTGIVPKGDVSNVQISCI